MRISAIVIAHMIALQELVLLVKCTSQRRALSVGSFFSGWSIPAIADTAGMLLGGRYGVVWCRSAAPLVPFQFMTFSFSLEELVIFVSIMLPVGFSSAP